MTVGNLGFVYSPKFSSNPSLSDDPISTESNMIKASDQVQLSSFEVIKYND